MNVVKFPGLDLSFEFSKIAFMIFGISVYKYAVCMVLGIVVALVLCKLNKEKLLSEIKEKRKIVQPNLIDQEGWEHVIPEIFKLAQLASVLTKKFDVMITNPPYLGYSSLEPACKEYIEKNLPLSIRYQPEDSESLYALPYPYLIPSVKGMFQEMYYWDTYFTNKGLLQIGKGEQAVNVAVLPKSVE